MTTNIYIKQIPVLRMLVGLCVGILIQFHCNISLQATLVFLLLSFILTFSFYLLKSFYQLRFKWLKTIFISCVFVGIGGLLAYVNNCRNDKYAALQFNASKHPALITLQDNIIERDKSCKVEASIDAVNIDSHWQKANGKILVYFNKKTDIGNLKYGSQIVVTHNIQPIINSGNPGGFNYAQYCYFQNIQYQAFLKDKDFIALPTSQTNWFKQFTINLRNNILQTLKAYIKNPDELSIAEALLIGYREDLDKDMVKAYSNTGVVHIIAISGLHLGMIYGLIVFLFKPLSRLRWSKIVKAITIISVLWMFSCIAGMAPSILRSAIMFTVIAIAEASNKKNNIYNNLALSAIIILVINPFSLWDVGFQLSYSAVLSIVLFSRYIKNWFYFNNKLANAIWSLNAITLSAQILTLPIVLYHFHQFPLLFFITNLVAVPLSGFILYAELLLIVLGGIKTIATFIGKITEVLIWLMNKFILWINGLQYVVVEYIQINIMQAIILFFVLIFCTHWLINKNSKSLVATLVCLCAFLAIRCVDLIQKSQQQKVIVYNVPNHIAIDLIEGNNYSFIGDSIMNQDGFLRNFHIKPSRILNRMFTEKQPQNIRYKNGFICCGTKVIAVIDKPLTNLNEKIKVDAVLITKKPKVYINQIQNNFDCKFYIIDGSNPQWKIDYWKKDCIAAKIPYFITNEDGFYSINFDAF